MKCRGKEYLLNLLNWTQNSTLISTMNVVRCQINSDSEVSLPTTNRFAHMLVLSIVILRRAAAV